MPTDHERWEQLIPDFVSGALSDAGSEEVRRHVGTCEQCAQAVEELRAVMVLLERERTRREPVRYFATVLPRVRARLDVSSHGRRGRPFMELALPALSLAFLAMIVLTIAPPWSGAPPQEAALRTAIGDIPADVLVDALTHQADQAGLIAGPAGTEAFAGLLTNELLERELLNVLSQDGSLLGSFPGAEGGDSLLLSDLTDTEITNLLQRLSEREIL